MKRITILLTVITVIALLLTGCTDVTDDAEKTTDAVTTGPIVEANPASDFEYIENEDGNIVIKRYVGDAVDVVIPETIDGKTVTEIGRNSFSNNYKLISVTIPNTVINIQNSAFFQCAFLVEINLPENLEVKSHFPIFVNYVLFLPIWSHDFNSFVVVDCTFLFCHYATALFLLLS